MKKYSIHIFNFEALGQNEKDSVCVRSFFLSFVDTFHELYRLKHWNAFAVSLWHEFFNGVFGGWTNKSLAFKRSVAREIHQEIRIFINGSPLPNNKFVCFAERKKRIQATRMRERINVLQLICVYASACMVKVIRICEASNHHAKIEGFLKTKPGHMEHLL